MKISIIEINKIREHEEIDLNNLEKVKNKIVRSGFFKEPIIVDGLSLVVLDGHHRLNSCKQLGLKKIPCVLVDYLKDKTIKVTTRRKNIFINKNAVIDMGLKNQVFPKKTTKHFIPYRIKNLKIPIKLLL